MTKTLSQPGAFSVGVTSTRPARSSGTPSVFASGEAATPARPQDGARRDAVLARLEVHGDAVVVDADDARVDVHLHAELRQLLSGLVAQHLGIGGEQMRRALEQEHARLARIDAAEVARQRVEGDLADGAGELDAGGAAADDDEGQPLALHLGVVGHALGLFERRQRCACEFRSRPRRS